MSGETLTGVHRATALLSALGAEAGARPGGVGVVELARAVGREKTQVSRTLKVLADAGFVERDPHTQGYRLGWRLFTLAAQAGDQPLLSAAPPILRDLVGSVDERAHLTVLQGSTVLTVLSERPRKAVQAAGWVGRTTPVHCTASGRAQAGARRTCAPRAAASRSRATRSARVSPTPAPSPRRPSRA